jgi:hypothetical protein
VYRLLIAPLTATQRAALDQLLLPLSGRPISNLAWLRQSPGEPSAKAVLAHVERLHAIRALDLPPEIGRNVHQNRLLRLAREGGQTAVYQIEEYETDRRHATLVAILLDTTATLTDEILNLHDRLIGSFFTRAKHKYEKRFAAEGKAVNDKVRLYGVFVPFVQFLAVCFKKPLSIKDLRNCIAVRRLGAAKPCWTGIYGR